MSTILLILLIVLLLGGLPQLGWHPYGYAPSSIVFVVVVVLLVLVLTGRL